MDVQVAKRIDLKCSHHTDRGPDGNCAAVITNRGVTSHNACVHHAIASYTFNSHNVTCELYLNKARTQNTQKPRRTSPTSEAMRKSMESSRLSRGKEAPRVLAAVSIRHLLKSKETQPWWRSEGRQAMGAATVWPAVQPPDPLSQGLDKCDSCLLIRACRTGEETEMGEGQ